MTTSTPSEEAVFNVARKLPPEDREVYLNQVCANNASLRGRVGMLLQADGDLDFLDPPNQGVDVTLARPLTEKPGATIGDYKLLETIGEGGFGVVFMAVQERPVRRKVALKIVKPGMDTQEVIARFEAERQALAMMDHPNIATVLDAGSTESGRPYFVMELVRGVPITEFCDSNKLATVERLRLFTTVCHAIQHAHQKGIIHRDIKPSNVLVTMHDDQAVPVVIDFGVAKATNATLTDRTLFTRFAQMIGTPLYMSPEQAQLSRFDVDTRADIYSLGVLLYELVTGTTPFNQQRLHEAAYDELLRIIREEEPPKPSARISTLGETLPTVAGLRRVEPDKLTAIVRGELDWIVMKAMDKNRNRRYESAGSFGRDIQRYLSDVPVEACPPSAVYTLRKFIRRNRGPVSTGVAVVAALLLGFIGTSIGLVKAYEKNRALEDTQNRLLAAQERLKDSLLHEAIIEAMALNEEAMEEKIKKARMLGASDAWVYKLRGMLAYFSGEYDIAIGLLKKAAELEPESVSVHALLAIAYTYAERPADQRREIRAYYGHKPQDDFDILLRATIEARFWDVRTAVAELEQLVKRRGSWELARVWLAKAKVNCAVDLGDWREAAEAAEMIAASSQRVPELRSVHVIQVMANLTAAVLVPEGLGDKERWLKEAGDAAQILKDKYLDDSRAELAIYYYQTGDIEQALALFEGVSGSGAVGNRSRAIKLGQAMLCEQKRYDDMLELHGISPLIAMTVGRDLDEVVKLCQFEILENPDSPVQIAWELLALYAAGEPGKAIAHWNRMLHEDTEMRWNLEYALKIFTGQWDVPDALAAAGSSRIKQSLVHEAFGMRRLYMDGDRAAAAEHFQRCLDTNIFAISYYYWAKSSLAHLQDDEWPQWLQEGAEK